jgi:acetyltransferase-like isoleucine patch superfamily enzyme
MGLDVKRSLRKAICKPVVIGDNVWLGEWVCVLRGVTIGWDVL